MGSLIAFIAGFVVVIGSIMSATDKPMAFIDIPSIIIVVGGTFVASFISYEAKNAVAGLKMALSTFRKHKDSENSLKDEVGRIVRWAYIIQKNGLQGLENEVTDDLRNENAFLAYGADLVVTGYTGAEIKQILEHMLESQAERNKRMTDVLMKLGGDAPAFGMLGTLIGLIIMLGNMAGDPSAIGPSMAVALVTTSSRWLPKRLRATMSPYSKTISRWKAWFSSPNVKVRAIFRTKSIPLLTPGNSS